MLQLDQVTSAPRAVRVLVILSAPSSLDRCWAVVLNQHSSLNGCNQQSVLVYSRWIFPNSLICRQPAMPVTISKADISMTSTPSALTSSLEWLFFCVLGSGCHETLLMVSLKSVQGDDGGRAGISWSEVSRCRLNGIWVRHIFCQFNFPAAKCCQALI